MAGGEKKVLWAASCQSFILRDITLREEKEREKWEERAWPGGQGWQRAAIRVKWMTFLRPLRSTWPGNFSFTSFKPLLSHISFAFLKFSLPVFPSPPSLPRSHPPNPCLCFLHCRANLHNVSVLLFFFSNLVYTTELTPVLVFVSRGGDDCDLNLPNVLVEEIFNFIYNL